MECNADMGGRLLELQRSRLVAADELLETVRQVGRLADREEGPHNLGTTLVDALVDARASPIGPCVLLIRGFRVGLKRLPRPTPASTAMRTSLTTRPLWAATPTAVMNGPAACVSAFLED